MEEAPDLTAEAVMEALPNPTLILGPDRKIAAANRAAEELLGKGLRGALARAVFRQPEEVELLRAGFAALAAPEAPQGPFRAKRREISAVSETIWQLDLAVVRAPELADGRLVLTLRNLSHLEEAEILRRDFVANVSHEMRSPLTALVGLIETLRDAAKDDDAASARFLEVMDNEAQRMTRLVSGLVSLGKLEAEASEFPRAKVDLVALVEEVRASMAPRVAAAGLAFEIGPMPEAAWVRGERDQLVQVLHNFIENAIKYGADGGRIALTLRASTAPGMAWEIELRDWGAGIDPIHIPRLTERFYRADPVKSRATGGTGLGLAIVKHILSRHRGRLAIRSTLGEGTRFIAKFPAA